jgi:hypothetical protein
MRLPLFGLRRPSRPSRQWARQVTTGKRGVPLAPPPAQPHDLIGVVGVGQTEEVGGLALTLLSLELYREGSIALFRLLRARGRFEREYPHPNLRLEVAPDGPVPYSIWPMGGGGSGGMHEIQYRLSYAIVPAPTSDASEIVVTVREIEWERWKQDGREIVSVDTGPWRYAVRLRPAGGITEGAS